MTHWTESALCRDHVTSPETDLWHDREGERGNPDEPRESPREKAARIREAKAICAECPVRLECLEDATADDLGIRGGLTLAERNTAVCGDARGTTAGRQRHMRARDAVCDPCRAAWNGYQAEIRRRNAARVKGAA